MEKRRGIREREDWLSTGRKESRGNAYISGWDDAKDGIAISLQSVSRKNKGRSGNEFGLRHSKSEKSVGHSEQNCSTHS